MVIQNFDPFRGQHCETTATGTLLKQIGIELSEPMLFGLGEGLGFIFWKMKTMDFPFIGGRVKPDLLTQNLCRNLDLQLNVLETSSKGRAWENVRKFIEEGRAVGLKLDCYHLDYFTNKIHFAGHYVALYGYDKEFAYLVDTQQQGGKLTTSLQSLALARSEKGPMSSKNLSFTILQKGKPADLKKAIKQAIRNNANAFLTPPIRNIGYKGIRKTSSEIRKWFQISEDVRGEFQTAANLMEKAGTGGALFRNLYRDFLGESAAILGSATVEKAYQEYAVIADEWKNVSELLHLTGETKSTKPLEQASKILINLAESERIAMEKLANAFEED